MNTDWIQALNQTLPKPFNDVAPHMADTLMELQLAWRDTLQSFETRQRFAIDALQPHPHHCNWVCHIQDGDVWEKAGINVTWMQGQQLPPAATERYPEAANCPFYAFGISSVIHPRNPMVPTTHANVRFFLALPSDGEPIWWFGGGYDLTPYYGFEEDCRHWHQTAKQACDPFGQDRYPRYKAWCDDYFTLKHRQEARGIGGLFFDDVNDLTPEEGLAFVQSVGKSFIDKAYAPIVAKRYQLPYTEAQRQFQAWRRGRYVEFNLIYDRGTLFGLQFGGRAESILVSMPPMATWDYDHQVAKGTPEERLLTEFLPARDWINS